MPGSSDIPRGNVELIQQLYIPAIALPASIPASSTAVVNLTVKGVRLYDLCAIVIQNPVVGLLVSNGLVVARDTIQVSVANVTTAAIAGAGPLTGFMTVVRNANVLDGGITALPVAIQ